MRQPPGTVIVSAIAIGCWLGEQAPQPLTDDRIRNAVWSAYPDEPERKPRNRMEALAMDFPGLFGE